MRKLLIVLPLLAPGACYTPPASPAFAEARYRCSDGSAFAVRFDNRIGAAFLRLPAGGEARLEQQRAASGFWYRSTEYELRGKGREAWIEKDGAARLDCVAD